MAASKLPQQLDWEKARTVWAQAINPVLLNAIVQGSSVSNVVLVASTPKTFSHGLGRTQQGWFVTDQNANAVIWRTADFNSSTLTLEASANVTLTVWCF